MKQRLIRLFAISTTSMFLISIIQYLNLDNKQVANAQSTRLRPDLNGLQLRNPGNSMVFWVDEGTIRHIENSTVYRNIFIPKSLDAIDTVSITRGPSISANNRLVRCGEDNHPLKTRVYLLDQGTKRHILSTEVFIKNKFNWDKVRTIDCPALAAIKDGPTIR